MAAPGSFSLGLSTKVLPAAIATGNIHSGIMAGKLNGVIPAQTPSGCRKECTSTERAAWSVCSPRNSRGADKRELQHLEPALYLAQRVGVDLPVLKADDLRQAVALGDHEVAQPGEGGDASADRLAGPLGESAGRGLDGGVDGRDVVEAHQAQRPSGGRIAHGAVRDRRRGHGGASDVVVHHRHGTHPSARPRLCRHAFRSSTAP